MEVRVVGGTSGSQWVQSVARLRQELSEGGFDLVHAQYGGRTALAAVAASRQPVVLSFCGTDLNGLGTGTRLERAYSAAGVICSQVAAPLASALIVKSDSLARKFWQRQDRHRCRVVPNGVDLELFRPIDRSEARMRLGWPLDRPVALASGQSDGPVKRLDIAAAAVELARRSHPHLALKLLRGVPPADVPWHLNAADVVILTSQHEGSPNIVKEALACNRAVVTVDVGDVRRWVAETPGCWLCDRRPEYLAEAIAKAVTAGGRAEGRGVVAAISGSNVAAQVLAIYEEALREPRAKGGLGAEGCNP